MTNELLAFIGSLESEKKMGNGAYDIVDGEGVVGGEEDILVWILLGLLLGMQGDSIIQITEGMQNRCCINIVMIVLF